MPTKTFPTNSTNPTNHSIQRHILFVLLLGLPLIWLLVSVITAASLLHEIDEITDTQMLQLAHHLASVPNSANLSNSSNHIQNQPSQMIVRNHDLQASSLGHADSDDMGFAVWDGQGRLLLADEMGSEFEFDPTFDTTLAAAGFVNISHQHRLADADSSRWQQLWHSIRHDGYRMLYLHDSEHDHVIAVGQKLEERREMVAEVLQAQLVPWLIGFLAMMGLSIMAVRRGLSPLKQISHQLNQRQAEDDTPMMVATAPEEIIPLMNALNALFVRVKDTLNNEKRFTADAAHELRSPLTALKIQTEVLSLLLTSPEQSPHLKDAQTYSISSSGSDGKSSSKQQPEAVFIDDNQHGEHNNIDSNEQNNEQSNEHNNQIEARLQHLNISIERMQHLLDQLLILAKLEQNDSDNAIKYNFTDIDWLVLSDEVLSQVNLNARQNDIRLQRQLACPHEQILPIKGDALLLALLLRNLLDNAIRYAPKGSQVILRLTDTQVCIIDNGEGVAPEHLTQLGQRFYRPAGQSQTGSGLGLSIVARIAQLHGLKLTLSNQTQGGFSACITPEPSDTKSKNYPAMFL